MASDKEKILSNSYDYFATQPTLMDSFQYVMHGRIFSLEHVGQGQGQGGGQRVEVQVSFGGLLLRVRGEQAQLSALEADMK